MIARDLQQMPTMDDFGVFRGRAVAVPGETLAGGLWLGADGGAYRSQLRTHFADGVAAAGLAEAVQAAIVSLTGEDRLTPLYREVSWSGGPSRAQTGSLLH